MRWWRGTVAAAAVMSCMMVLGCAGEWQNRKVTDLETRVSELEASNAELRRQLEEVNTRIQMLQARASVAAPAVSSSALPPPPAPAAAKAPGRAAPAPNLEVVKLKPASPTNPKPLSAWPQQPVFRTADGKAISLPKATEPAPEPGESAAASAPPVKSGDPAKTRGFAAYQEAMQLFDDRKYAEALVKFQQISEDPKAADLHDNARYWMGECYYAQNDFQKAVEEFIKLANDYPESDKAPDALYKAGLAYDELNQREAAMETLREVVVLYPFSDSARLAEAKIKEWSR